jgi:organic radical activating enzyme
MLYLPVFSLDTMEYNQTAHNENTFDYFVQWHLTERCNLACTHCYQEGKNVAEMALPEIKSAIKNISDTIRQWSDIYEIPFSTSFSITGGEPFLRKDLPKILQEINGHNFGISILTNGTLIEKEKAKMLADLPVKNVQVSLEGPEAIHEAVRGRRSFSSAVRGIELLRDAGIKITINVTLSDMNADYFKDMVVLASDLGVSRLGFSRLVPSGRGLALLTRMLTKERLKEVYEAIFSLKTPGLEIVTGDPVASQMSEEIPESTDGSFPEGGCAAGVSGSLSEIYCGIRCGTYGRHRMSSTCSGTERPIRENAGPASAGQYAVDAGPLPMLIHCLRGEMIFSKKIPSVLSNEKSVKYRRVGVYR